MSSIVSLPTEGCVGQSILAGEGWQTIHLDSGAIVGKTTAIAGKRTQFTFHQQPS